MEGDQGKFAVCFSAAYETKTCLTRKPFFYFFLAPFAWHARRNKVQHEGWFRQQHEAQKAGLRYEMRGKGWSEQAK